MRKVFLAFRQLIEALQSVSKALDALVSSAHQGENASERLQSLELSRSVWEAEVEGVLAKAEGKLKASNNAEARTRTMEKSFEGFFEERDPHRPEAEGTGNGVPGDDEAYIEKEGMHVLSVGVARTPRQRLIRAKFGLGG